MKKRIFIYSVVCLAIILTTVSYSRAQSEGCGDCIEGRRPKVGSCFILVGEYEGESIKVILATGDKRKCKKDETNDCPIDYQTGCHRSGTLPEYVSPT